jgi:hypothetical protein
MLAPQAPLQFKPRQSFCQQQDNQCTLQVSSSLEHSTLLDSLSPMVYYSSVGIPDPAVKIRVSKTKCHKAGSTTHVRNKRTTISNQMAFLFRHLETKFAVKCTDGYKRSRGPQVVNEVTLTRFAGACNVAGDMTINAGFHKMDVREIRVQITNASDDIGKLWYGVFHRHVCLIDDA